MKFQTYNLIIVFTDYGSLHATFIIRNDCVELYSRDNDSADIFEFTTVS